MRVNYTNYVYKYIIFILLIIKTTTTITPTIPMNYHNHDNVQWPRNLNKEDEKLFN